MQKKVLSEIDLHYGTIDMPKGFEIDRDKLQQDILSSQIKNSKFPFSRSWDMLNTYVRDHARLEYGFTLVNKEMWDIPLKNNDFIMFPSTQMYYITNNQKDSLNFILTTSYEFI